MWGIFRNKQLKALDTIYRNYEKIYNSYREFADSDNEFFHAQARIIRADLFTIGAAFDKVIAEAGPDMLEKCYKEYGYIPYTATCVRLPGIMVTQEGDRAPYNEDLIGLLDSLNSKVSWSEDYKTVLGSKLWLRNKKLFQKERTKFLEYIQEGVELGVFEEVVSAATGKRRDIILLNEIIHLPKCKAKRPKEVADDLYKVHSGGNEIIM